MDKRDFLDVAELDVMEESIWRFDSSILRRLLQDKTTKKNTVKRKQRTVPFFCMQLQSGRQKKTFYGNEK